VQRSTRVRWARTEALPRIEELLAQSTWLEWGTAAWEAHELAAEAARFIEGDPTLEARWSSVTKDIVITSDPPGADVWAKAYSDVDGEWRHQGRTPLDPLRFPFGASRVKVELAGYRTAHDMVMNVGYLGDTWHFRLQSEDAIPEEMVFVPTGKPALFLPGIDHLDPEESGDFLIDAHEVTNREFKRFVDAGGYESPDYWTHGFARDGREVAWEDAMALFVDGTGRPGPAGWEVGDYADGRDDYPVSGISWYEAAAYAEFAEKSLPTVFHWNQVALTFASGEISPLSNLEGDGLLPAGSGHGMNRYGAYDLAGNVREWCYNASTRDDQRFILGGGWVDPPYGFNDAIAQSPWDRSETNGFRCIRYLRPEDRRAELVRTVDMPFRDFYNETPVSDETFAIYVKQFDYDRTPLNAHIESEEEHDDWVQQRVGFDAAYGDERMEAWLLVPRTGTPPYSSVVYFPGSNAIHTRSSAEFTGRRFAPLLKSGRAVIFPIYKGTYERGDELDSDYPDETNFYKDHVIMWGKDLARSIDYLESREDLTTEQLVYYGVSWGGVMGTILPAVEDRIRVNLLYVAGLLFQRALPEVDQINYVSRVRQPTLMINGEFDFFFPVETSQKPLHDLLGTPEEHKRYVVYPGSHAVPRAELVRELLDWLDRYQPQ
jgi:pimeloyl-ACP methyl ester carboxylesterase